MKPTLGEQIVYRAVEAGELEIDAQGRVWRIKKRTGMKKGGTVLVNLKRRRAEHDTGSYLQMRVMTEGERVYCQAHRLVYYHFYGPIPEDIAINHKNGKKKDNRPENLEMTTYSENTIHAVHTLKVGRAANQNGQMNHNAKVTPEIVQEILAVRDIILKEMETRHGHRITELATKYGISYQTVWDIIKGRRWNSS
jgi:hypothetical protein